MSLLDHPVVSTRYFFPRRDPLPAPFRITAADGSVLACHLARHGGSRTLVHFHGNGEVVADNLPLVDELRALDLDVLLVEYRGYGGSTGTPALGGMLEDVEPVFAALGLPEDRLVAFGRSVGSLYALELARRHPGLAGLVLESGIADVLERLLLRLDPAELGCSREELAAEVTRLLDHRSKLAAFRGPLLVLHAEHDHLVDVSHAVRNHGWAGSERKRLVRFPRGDHNSILFENWPQYWREVGEFVAGLGERA